MILFIVGPTGVGKSEAAVLTAEALDGEIVSLDSRQFYRGMDIGTAKPTPSDRRGITHHLIDIAEPSETVPMAIALKHARHAAADVLGRGHVAILAGGTGQYVRALREGWVVPAVAPDVALRAELEMEGAESVDGGRRLHARLAAVDSVSATLIDPRNVRRVIRALEVYATTGTPFSVWRSQRTDAVAGPVLGLRRGRAELFTRIDRRIDRMLGAGLQDEVSGLVAAGYGFELPAMSAVGYGEWEPFFAGSGGIDQVSQAIRANTRRLVRKQASWFRPDDPAIEWVDAADRERTVLAARRMVAAASSPA